MTYGRYCYLVEIQGIGEGSGTGTMLYCWPEVPDYATADPRYVAGLLEPPSAVSADWDVVDGQLSVGRFRLIMDPRVGPVNWTITRPRPVCDVREDLTAGETIWDLSVLNSISGIAANTVIFGERESVRVTVAAAGAKQITVVRGYANTENIAHDEGMDLFLVPPTMIGREVTVYRTERVGGSSGDETEIHHGYINSEPSHGAAFVAFSVVDRFVKGEIPSRLVGRELPTTSRDPEEAIDGPLFVCPPRTDKEETYTTYPAGNTTGMYWLVKPSGNVYPMEYVAAGGGYEAGWQGHASDLIWGDPEATWGELGERRAYPILLSNTDLQYYPAFRYLEKPATWHPSDHPAVITLNLLMSIDGTNTDAGDAYNYDLGNHTTTAGGLAPTYSLQIDRDYIDLEAFEAVLFGYGADLRAPSFWLGGTRKQSIQEILYRLWAPTGHVCGCNRAGVWTLLRLKDCYPNQGLTIDGLLNAGAIRHLTQSRATNTITVHVDPGPDGETVNVVYLDEVDGRNYYPEQVGQDEEYVDSPYRIADYDEESTLFQLISRRLTRLSQRIALLEDCEVRPEYFDSIDLGTLVRLYDPVIRDPETGERLDVVYTAGVLDTTNSDSVAGIVTNVKADLRDRVLKMTVALADQGHLALIAPSATVVSYLALVYTVTAHDWTHDGDGDGARFVAGDRIVLCDSHLVQLTDNAITVQSSTDTTITVDNAPTMGGVPVVPAAGDVIVFDDYDSCQSSQTDTYAFEADGGDWTTPAPTVGAAGDDPYEYGE